MRLKNKKVLVTEGAGFIGSNLCEELLKNGNEIVCLDNFSTGKKVNITELQKYNSFNLIEGDIRNLQDCERAVKGCEIVFHQAALGSVPRSLKDPITTNEINVTGFVNMISASVKAKVKRFIYAASSSTYGDSKELLKVEDEIGKPLSPYAVTKYVNELYAEVFSKEYTLETIGLRYFNVFGRKQDPEGAYATVIPKFIKLLMDKQSPVINGDGSHSRDFTYIDNVIQANILAGTVNNKGSLNQVYNIAYGESNTLNDLVEELKKKLSNYDEEISNIEIIYGPERAGDIKNSLASIEKAKKLLNYSPKYNFKDGMEKSIEWYWKNLN